MLIKSPIRSTSKSTWKECERLKDSFVVDDLRGERSLFSAVWWQFYAHQTTDSFKKDGEWHNRYEGVDRGLGIYPPRRGNPIYTPDGYFELSEEGGLPLFVGNSGTKEIAGDIHRVNENFLLKAMHLAFCKGHNKRMDVHGDFDLAFDEKEALRHRVVINELMEITPFTEEEILSKNKVKGFNNSDAWIFAASRWDHAGMPDTVNGRDIFDRRVRSQEVDILSTITHEKARKLNMGTSSAMTKMHHVNGDFLNIVDFTIARHLEHNLPTFGDCARSFGIDLGPNKDLADWPIWPAELKEAERQGDGKLGPLGSEMVATAIAQSIRPALEQGKGLRHRRWPGAPVETLEIIDYMIS